MKEKDISHLKALHGKLQNYIDHPWILRRRSFHVIGNVYFVGNNYVLNFLIDGGEDGLLLIDCVFQETVYLLFDSTHVLDFDPANARRLFLSHGHVDHYGAAQLIQKYSGCEVFLGERDHFFFAERPDLILFEKHVPHFPVHHFYEYNRPIVWDNTSITSALTPGHTPGTTSFLTHTPYRGGPVTCAVHGGVKINGLSQKEPMENRLPLALQRKFLNSLECMKKEKVEVVLASHAHQYNMLERATRDDGIGAAFLDDRINWSCMVGKHIALVRELVEE